MKKYPTDCINSNCKNIVYVIDTKVRVLCEKCINKKSKEI